VLMLATFFGPVSVGFYTLSNTVLQQPIRLVGDAFGDVFYPKISKAFQNGENLYTILLKSTLILAAIGSVPFGILILFGPSIFSMVFGFEWFDAGRYAQWIAVFLYFEFINKPCIKTLPVISAQLIHLIITIISTVARLSSLLVGYYIFNSDLIAIA